MLLPGLLLAATLTSQPSPQEVVLRHVPPDTAVVLVVQKLRDQAAAVAKSPFADWAATKFGPKVAGSNEFTVLKGFEKILTETLGVTAAEMRDDVLGDAVVFAFTPGVAGNAESDRGVILLHARDSKKLRSIIDKLNAAQLEREELKAVEADKYRDRTYQKRLKPGGGAEYYYLDGPLFAFSGQETMIRAVIDRGMDAPESTSAAAAGLKTLGLQNAFLAAWVNPRALDKDLAAQAESETNPSKRAFLNQLARVWAATEGAGVGLTVERDITLQAAVAVNSEKIPAELRPFLTEQPIPLTVPTGAMIAVAARVRADDWFSALASFAPAADRATLRKDLEKAIGPIVGRDQVAAVLAAIGPVVSFAAYQPVGEGTWPPRLVLDVQLADEPKGRAGVEKLTKFWAQLLAVEFNKTHDDQIDVGEVDGKTELRNETGFPRGFRPSFGVDGGRFVLMTAQGSTTTGRGGPATLYAEANAVLVRKYLLIHGESLAAWLARQQGRDVAAVTKELTTIYDLLEPIEGVELTALGRANTASITLKIRTVKPLK